MIHKWTYLVDICTATFMEIKHVLLKKLKLNKIATAVILTALASTAHAGYKIKLTDKDTIEFGGYVKADARYVTGEVAYRDYWIGTGTAGQDKSQFKISARETRFNTKYSHGEVMAFIELDFASPSVGGNEIVSNSYSPRLRHGFIKYKNVLFGQTWTTFANLSALAEAADFGGPLVAAAFIRQGQIRYTNGGLQLSMENPESDKGDPSQDSKPDFVAKYTFKGDWGNVAIAGLARQLTTETGANEGAFGYGISGRINTLGKDDFRFQVHAGNTGRYVGVVAARDLVGEDVEESKSVSVAYRHFWTKKLRSSLFYGNTTTEYSDVDRTHWGINLFTNYTPQLAVGVELGNFELGEQDVSSSYAQLSAKYSF